MRTEILRGARLGRQSLREMRPREDVRRRAARLENRAPRHEIGENGNGEARRGIEPPMPPGSNPQDELAAAAPSGQSDDEALVARVLAGERDCFGLLVRRYNQRLFRVVRAIVSSDAEAEDAVQQAYVACYANLTQFEGTAKFSTWLTRIAINEGLQRVRARKRAHELLAEGAVSDWRSGTGSAHTPEEQASTRQLGRLLEAAIDALPESCRVAVVLREIEGLSTEETAHCLGLTEEAVRVRIHRARELLREALYEKVGAGSAEVFPFAGARCERMLERVLEQIRGAAAG